jgi:glucose-1-phosphate cytidylyltransferase
VANINIRELVDFHVKQKSIGTISGVHPITRFGVLSIDEETKKVKKFKQFGIVDEDMSSQQIHQARKSYINDFINGGFMVFKNSIFKYIKPDSMIEEAFVPLAKGGRLSVQEHTGLWKAMDTYKDVEEMNILWQKDPFWKVWKD